MNEQTAWQEQTEIQTQYEQLLKRGDLKKVALTACILKLLTILISSPCGNAMLRDQ
ncbi:MAG TPA: hypothetical protein VK206_00140 [Anaerolineales bacterium]|nr:hypothetical protein [Anaerolineales bacterium]